MKQHTNIRNICPYQQQREDGQWLVISEDWLALVIEEKHVT